MGNHQGGSTDQWGPDRIQLKFPEVARIGQWWPPKHTVPGCCFKNPSKSCKINQKLERTKNNAHSHLAKFQLTSISKGTIEPGKRIFDVLEECQNWKWSSNIYSYSANIVQWYASMRQPSFPGPNPSQPLCPPWQKKSVPKKTCQVTRVVLFPLHHHGLSFSFKAKSSPMISEIDRPLRRRSLFLSRLTTNKQKFRHVDEEGWANKIEVRAKETI